MARIACSLSIIVILLAASPLVAQEAPAVKSITIEEDGFGFKFLPLGVTHNNTMVVFYEHWTGSSTALKARFITASGNPGQTSTIAASIDSRMWDAVWHPVLKRFVVVYRLNNALYARPVGQFGAPLSPAKKLCDYSDVYIHIAWTNRKKFVLFITRGGQVVAQALKKNGKKKKGEQAVTGVAAGEAYPVGAATEDDGTAVAYYAHYVSSTNLLTPRLVKVNHKPKNVIADFAISSPRGSTAKATFVGAYDPASQTHSVAWRFVGAGGVNARYCTFYESGAMRKHPTAIPGRVSPRALLYNPSTQRFAILFIDYAYFAPPDSAGPAAMDHTELHLVIYNPSGSIADSDYLIWQGQAEHEGYGVGHAKNGSLLAVMSYETIAGIFGRFIY